MSYDRCDPFVAVRLRFKHLVSWQPGNTTVSRRDLGRMITRVELPRNGVRRLSVLCCGSSVLHFRVVVFRDARVEFQCANARGRNARDALTLSADHGDSLLAAPLVNICCMGVRLYSPLALAGQGVCMLNQLLECWEDRKHHLPGRTLSLQ